MNLKKVLSLALAGAMCLSLLAGCSGGAPNPPRTPAPKPSLPVLKPPPPGGGATTRQ